MTRINVIDPTQLTDQHVMSEYRELPMVMGALRRIKVSKSGWQLNKVSANYTLNKGHVYFFTNKKPFLLARFHALVDELKRRGYSVNPDDRIIDWNVFDGVPQMDWKPDFAALEVNRARVRERILAKPQWYKYQKKPITSLPCYGLLTNPDKLWDNS